MSPDRHLSVQPMARMLAARIRQLRTKAELTQAELARRAGVTVETVARLERTLRGRASANANPSLETMARLAAALGAELKDLLSDDRLDPSDHDPLMLFVKRISEGQRFQALRVLVALRLTPREILALSGSARSVTAPSRSTGQRRRP